MVCRYNNIKYFSKNLDKLANRSYKRMELKEIIPRLSKSWAQLKDRKIKNYDKNKI